MNLIPKIVMDPFCYKQFDPKSSTSCFIDYPKDKFTGIINEMYDPKLLQNGYAPFCKHLIIKNFTPAKASIKEITESNENLLKTIYEAREAYELPVLRRYFPKDKVELENAQFLDIILYSKQQIDEENKARNQVDLNTSIDYEYAIVSVKPQMIDSEIPMDPITIMRNALGKEEGGSGVKLDRQAYMKSVEFWSKHAIVKI